MQKKLYWVYILHCDNDSYYTGYTVNLERRYASHLDGNATCKYTRSFKPLTISQCWQVVADKSKALKLERHIKKQSREEKMKLIKRPSLLAEAGCVKVVAKRVRLAIIKRASLCL